MDGSQKMSGTYVTDITHYLDDAGEIVDKMPSEAKKLAEHKMGSKKIAV